MSPIRGVVDLSGATVALVDAMAGKGDFPWPLPLTRAIVNGFRPEDHYGSEDVLSATELIGPPQISQLRQRHDLYVDPLASLWAMFGTIAHSILETYGGADALIEQKMVYDFEGQKIAGTLDMYADGVGYDWKVTSAYSVKGMCRDGVRSSKPEYYWQAQVYKYLLWHTLAKKAHYWNLVLICRDWNARTHGRDIQPVEVVPVPLEPIAEIERYIRERVNLHHLAAACADPDLPQCSPAETWNGRRCKDYCAVAPHCHQYKGV